MIQKLTFKEKFGYGLGDMAANFVFQAMLALQLASTRDTFGLTAGQAATLFLVVGLSRRRFQSGDGRDRRPHQHAVGQVPPVAAVDRGSVRHHRRAHLHHAEHQPGGQSSSTHGSRTCCCALIYTVNNVPYASLTAVMTGDPDERTSIASYRQIFANSAGFIVQSLAIPMVAFFGHGNDARGYQLTMGLLSVLSVLFFIIAFATTKERIQPDPQQKTSLGAGPCRPASAMGPGSCCFWSRLFYFAAIVDARQRHAALLQIRCGQREPLQLVQRIRPGRAAGWASPFSTAVSVRVGQAPALHRQHDRWPAFSIWRCSSSRRTPPSSIIASEVLRQFCVRIVRPDYLGDDGRRGRLRRMENGPPRHGHRNRGGGLRAVGGPGAGRRHCRLAFLVLWLCRRTPCRRPMLWTGILLTASALFGAGLLRHGRRASSSIPYREKPTRRFPMSWRARRLNFRTAGRASSAQK